MQNPTIPAETASPQAPAENINANRRETKKNTSIGEDAETYTDKNQPNLFSLPSYKKQIAPKKTQILTSRVWTLIQKSPKDFLAHMWSHIMANDGPVWGTASNTRDRIN